MRMLHLESVENMRRVGNLILMHSKLVEANIGTKEQRSDILRAAVVFLHGSIEEIVRNLFVDRLHRGKTEMLNELGYSAYGPANRSKGVLLGDLLKNHGGRFVDNVIFDAINAHVDILNINNADQLVAQLRKVDINAAPVAPYLENLDKIMRRRHQIVHQMDREDSLDPDTRPIAEISASYVKEWFDTTIEFNKEIFRQISDESAQGGLSAAMPTQVDSL